MSIQPGRAGTRSAAARLEALCGFGADVPIVARPGIFQAVGYALRYTASPIRIALGALMKALARRFACNVRMYVHAMPATLLHRLDPAVARWIGEPGPDGLIGLGQLALAPPPASHLLRYLIDSGFLRPVPVLAENLVGAEIMDVFGGPRQAASMLAPALRAFLATFRSLPCGRAALHAEVLALRHQLLILERQCAGRRVQFRTADRVLWSWLSRLWPGWRHALVLVRPETVIRWHRCGLRLYWRWKSGSRRPGRPSVEVALRDLILEMHRADPTWGAPRIHGERRKLGFAVAPSIVSKSLPRHRKPPSQS